MGKPKDPESSPLANARNMDQAADGPVAGKKAIAEDDTKPESASAQKVPKKRTKTGCLSTFARH